MRTIKAGEFKAKCLALLDEVAASGETIEITKRGKVVARLGPARDVKELFGRGRDEIVTVDPNDDFVDILSPEDIALWYAVDEDDDLLPQARLAELPPRKRSPRR